MSATKFVLKAIEVRAKDVFGKVREAANEKVEVIKAFSEHPKFIGTDNPNILDFVTVDGTKSCFMFNGWDPAKEFANELSEQLGIKCDVDSYIGHGVVYVPVHRYEEAIRKGLNVLLVKQNGCWINFYNERIACDYEPILDLQIHSSCFDKNGKLKKSAEVMIGTWIKSLEKILGEETLHDKAFGSNIQIGIKRKPDAYLKHDEMLGKIRKSGLLENSPFEGYAYIDYCGKYMR